MWIEHILHYKGKSPLVRTYLLSIAFDYEEGVDTVSVYSNIPFETVVSPIYWSWPHILWVS